MLRAMAHPESRFASPELFQLRSAPAVPTYTQSNETSLGVRPGNLAFVRALDLRTGAAIACGD
jgi:hypothetical protein